jgi:hypothetical protein
VPGKILHENIRLKRTGSQIDVSQSIRADRVRKKASVPSAALVNFLEALRHRDHYDTGSASAV